MSRYPRMVLITLLSLTTAACSDGGPRTIATATPTLPSVAANLLPQVTTDDTVATKLGVPWGVTFLPDGSALVTERMSRRVLRLVKGAGHDAPYTATEVGVITEAASRGEGGLLGIVASPSYASDQTLYIYYTSEEDNRIARWKIGSRPEPILTGIPAGGNHNGGRLAFGPDGYLYASTGEVGDRPMAQDLKALGGKILRMTTDGKPAPGNPFGTLVWSYGHRNVQGLAWDSGGHLWATEFGQNTWDEINRIEPGKNYGWPEVEGKGGDSRYVDPIVVWPTSESSCSGAAILNNILVAGCLRGQRVWLMSIDGATGTLSGQPSAQLVGKYGRIRTPVVTPDHSLWLMTSNRDNRASDPFPKADDDRIINVTLGTA